MVRQSFIVVVTFIGLQSVGLMAADTVTRKSDGKKLGGTITGITKTELKVKKAIGEPDTIQANDVAAVDWDGATGDLRLGASDENGGKYELAIQRYTKSKSDSKSPSEGLKAEFD